MTPRLQKKCFIASAGFHLTLVVILFVGPAFLSSDPKVEDRPLIDFVPLITVDQALSGGGNPNARPPAPQAQPPAQPVAPPQRAPEATPPPPQPQAQKPDPVKPERDDDPDPAPSTKPVRKLPQVSLKQVTRNTKTTTKPSPNTSDSDESKERARETARRQAFNSAVRGAAQGLQQGFSGSTSVEMPGPGGGGVPYANFFDAVKKIYSDAWIPPDGAADGDASVTVSITIAKNGDVLASRITKASNNAAVNQSVQATLDRVRRAVPLPETAKESQRIVPITFNARAKRGLG